MQTDIAYEMMKRIEDIDFNLGMAQSLLDRTYSILSDLCYLAIQAMETDTGPEQPYVDLDGGLDEKANITFIPPITYVPIEYDDFDVYSGPVMEDSTGGIVPDDWRKHLEDLNVAGKIPNYIESISTGRAESSQFFNNEAQAERLTPEQIQSLLNLPAARTGNCRRPNIENQAITDGGNQTLPSESGGEAEVPEEKTRVLRNIRDMVKSNQR